MCVSVCLCVCVSHTLVSFLCCRVPGPDEPPTSEEANEVVEVKAEEAPTSDALSYMPGRVSQLIADYAFNLEEKFLNTYIVPGFYEPEHFEEMEGWDSKKVQAFKDYLEKRHDGVRELVEEALRDFEYGEEGEGYEGDEAGADEGEAKAPPVSASADEADEADEGDEGDEADEADEGEAKTEEGEEGEDEAGEADEGEAKTEEGEDEDDEDDEEDGEEGEEGEDEDDEAKAPPAEEPAGPGPSPVPAQPVAPDEGDEGEEGDESDEEVNDPVSSQLARLHIVMEENKAPAMAPSAAFSFANAGQPLRRPLISLDRDSSDESDSTEDNNSDPDSRELPTDGAVDAMTMVEIRNVIRRLRLNTVRCLSNGRIAYGQITTSGAGRTRPTIVAEVKDGLNRIRLARLQHESGQADRRAQRAALRVDLRARRAARNAERAIRRALRRGEPSIPVVEQKQAPVPAPAQPAPTPAPGPAPIPFSSMDFGDCDDSLCGICGRHEPGVWDGDELQEDIICRECAAAGWNYDEGTDCYVCLGPTKHTFTRTHCTHVQALRLTERCRSPSSYVLL